MSKLIIAFRTCPTATNRDKLSRYLAKHLMASCMATPEETAFLRANGFNG